MYSKAAVMAEELLLDVFSRFKAFIQKKERDDYKIPLIVKREGYGTERNSDIIFPFDMCKSQKEQLLAFSSVKRTRQLQMKY